MKYTANDINKMKVFELRKLVSEHNIFKGGLSSLKKADIIDKIYNSDWWRLNKGELTEKEAIEQRLAELQKKLEEQKLQEEQKQVVVEPVEPKPIAVEPDETELVETIQEPEQKQQINIDEIVQQALEKQRNELMKRLFG